MRSRVVVTLAAFLASAAYGADPDAFPVKNGPDIDEEAPDVWAKNRESAPLKNQEPPSERLAMPALEVWGGDASPKSEKTVQQEEEPVPPAAESTATPAPAETAPPPPEEPADAPAERGLSPKRVGSWAKKTSAELQAQVSGLFKKKRGPEEGPDPKVDDLDEEAPEPEALDRDKGDEAPLAIAEKPPEHAYLDEGEEALLAIAEAAPERRWRYQQRTVFGTRKRSGAFGVYGAWTGIQTGFGTGPVDTNGLELAAVFGSRLVLGGALYSTGGFAGGSHDARFFYGGLQTGWIFGSRRLLHPRADLLLGSGAMWDQGTGRHVGSATVIVPRVGLELNVSRAFRVAGSVGYRYVAAPGEAGTALSAPEMGLTLRFGWL